MKTAIELMDSRKFVVLMTTLAEMWDQGMDGECAEKLQAVLDFARGDEKPMKLSDCNVPGYVEGGRLDTHVEWATPKPRGIEALIPVPRPFKEIAEGIAAGVSTQTPILDTIAKNMIKREKKAMDAMIDAAEARGMFVDQKPKRKRRTKAEMAAAKGEDGSLKKKERIKPPTEDESQRVNAPHIIAMLKKVSDRAVEIFPAPVFQVFFTKEEGQFIQELPVYLEAGNKFHVLEQQGYNSQHQVWMVKIGRK